MSIEAKDVWELVERYICFPRASICKHLVAADLLSLLEKSGVEVSNELAAAVVNADDEVALRLLRGASR